MRLYRIKCGSETDWVAATGPIEALETYRTEYALSLQDISDADVSEVPDADSVEVYLDEVDAETGDRVVRSASDVMAEMARPGIVCSTAY